MTSRAGGRHRRRLSPQRLSPQRLSPQRLSPQRLSPQRLQNSLLLDPGSVSQPGLYLNSGIVPNGYLNSGVVPNGSRLFGPGLTGAGAGFGTGLDGAGAGPVLGADPAFGTVPGGGRRALRTALARDRRTFALVVSATLAGITGAVVFGSIAPLHSTGMTHGGHGAAGSRPPQASASWTAAPQGSPSMPVTSPPSPRRTGQAHRSARPSGRALTPQSAAQGSWTSTGTASTRTGPAVQATYIVDGQGISGFQGQVEVTNYGTQPIADWQIVIALPDDTVTSISNASGFVSHGILLMQQAAVVEVVPPDGGTLNVFFVAEGFETAPAACAFNGIPCS
jgi:Cellulose binding domain